MKFILQFTQPLSPSLSFINALSLSAQPAVAVKCLVQFRSQCLSTRVSVYVYEDRTYWIIQTHGTLKLKTESDIDINCHFSVSAVLVVAWQCPFSQITQPMIHMVHK